MKGQTDIPRASELESLTRRQTRVDPMPAPRRATDKKLKQMDTVSSEDLC